MKKNTIVKAVIATVKGTTDKGFESQKKPNSLTNKPKNIKMEMLKPTENKTVSRKFTPLSLKNFRRTNPGMSDK